MKLVFHDLGSIKKEASKLHKLAKSKGLPSKLSNAQNAIANHYGWQHYNEMSMAHERIALSNMYDSIDSDGKFIYEKGRKQLSGLALVTSLSDIQKQVLDGQLYLIVRNYFISLGADNSSADRWVDEFKSSKGLIKKFFQSSKENVTDLMSLPSKALARGTMILSESAYDRSDVYSSLALPHATINGGVLMLESHVAKKLIPETVAMSDGKTVSILKTDFYAHEDHADSERVEAFQALPLAFEGTCSCLVSQAISIELEDGSVNSVGDSLIGDKVSLQERISLKDFLSQVGSELQSGTFNELNFIRDTLEMVWAIQYKDNHERLEDWSREPILDNKQSPLCFKLAAYMQRYGFCNVISDDNNSGASAELSKKRFLDSELIINMLLTLKTLGIYIDAIDPWYTIKSHERLGFLSRLKQGHIIVIPMDSDSPRSLFMSKMIFRQYRAAHICLLGTPLEDASDQGKIIPPRRERVLGGGVFVTDDARVLSCGGSIVFAQLRATGLRSIVNITEHGMDGREHNSLRANVAVVIFTKLDHFLAEGREFEQIDLSDNKPEADSSFQNDLNPSCLAEKMLLIRYINGVDKKHKTHWQVVRVKI